jgi:hypothetical protein
MQFVMKVIKIWGLEMGRFDVFMIGRLLRGGSVQGSTQQLVKGVFDGAILVLESLNRVIKGAKVGIDFPNVLLVLGVFNDHNIEFLVMGESHL